MRMPRFFATLTLAVFALVFVPCDCLGAELVIGQNYHSVQLRSATSAADLQESLALVMDQPYPRIDQRGAGFALRVGYWENGAEAVQAARALSAKFPDAKARIATYRPDAIVAATRVTPPTAPAPFASTPPVSFPGVPGIAQQPPGHYAGLPSPPKIPPAPTVEPAQLLARPPVVSREPQQINAELASQLEYQLGAGDSIRIVVFQNADLTLETRVTENGTITFPLIGTVKIGGLSISGAEKVIAQALKDGGIIRSPQVNIALLQNRGSQVSVLGQVNRPGRFPLETLNIRVSEMIAMAGGIAPTGADVAMLSGVRAGRPFRVEIDIADLFLNNKPQGDLVVSGGDVIYVHRMPLFYIYGETQHPGSYRVERGMTVRQALAQGGGPTVRGTERRLRLYRRAANGSVESLSPGLGDRVQADDVIYVDESIF